MTQTLQLSRRVSRALAFAVLLPGLLATGLAQAQTGAAAIVTPVAAAALNPYGLRSVWLQGDWVARGTLAILALMSLLSWYFIIAKWLAQRQLDAQVRAARHAFAGAGSLQRRGEALADAWVYAAGTTPTAAVSSFVLAVMAAVTGGISAASVACAVSVATWAASSAFRVTSPVMAVFAAWMAASFAT